VKRQPIPESAPRSALLCSTVATTEGAAGRTEHAFVLKAGQAQTVVFRFVMPYIIIIYFFGILL
jgi:hypothetical protein